MSKDDYEIDYDDDGNEFKRRVTKDMLKARLKASEKRADEAWKTAAKASERARLAQQRLDNAYWCDRLKAVLDDGWFIATDLKIEAQAGHVDVTSVYSTATESIPAQKTAFMHVTFTGDEALFRFANFLKDTR